MTSEIIAFLLFLAFLIVLLVSGKKIPQNTYRWICIGYLGGGLFSAFVKFLGEIGGAA